MPAEEIKFEEYDEAEEAGKLIADESSQFSRHSLSLYLYTLYVFLSFLDFRGGDHLDVGMVTLTRP